MSGSLWQTTANLLASAARAQLARTIGSYQTSRSISISSVMQARQANSSSGDRKTGGQGAKKKGFVEMAKDRLSSGMSKNSCQFDRGPPLAGDRQTRSSSSRQEAGASKKRSPSGDSRRGSNSGGKRPKMRGASPTNHRTVNSVRHDKRSHRFILDLGNNHVARIDYRPIGKNLLELYHTEVPKELRGCGIAKLLAKGAFDCASKDKLKLKVTCDYLEDYLKRFADAKHKKLIEK